METIFAVVEPTTLGSLEESVEPSRHASSTKFVHSASSPTPSTQLRFGSIFGCRCIYAGTSRRCKIRWGPAEVMCQEHFTLHFELHTGILLITDISENGLWLASPEGLSRTCLRGGTWPVVSGIRVFCHPRGHCGLQITVPAWLRIESPWYRDMLDRYRQSIDARDIYLMPPIGIRQDCFEQLLDGYVELYRINSSASPNRVSACLRTRDAHLVCVKVLRGGESRPGTASVSKASDFHDTRQIRHPNIVRFVVVDHTSLRSALVMEFCQSGSLADVLPTLPHRRLSIDAIRCVVRQCLQAVLYLHERSLTHRAISVDHMLVMSMHPLKIKMCGFSSARRDHTLYSPQRCRQDLFDVGVVALQALGEDLQGRRGWMLDDPGSMEDFRSLEQDLFAAHVGENYLPLLRTLLAGGQLCPRALLLHDSWLKTTHLRKRAGRFSEDEHSIVYPNKRQKIFHSGYPSKRAACVLMGFSDWWYGLAGCWGIMRRSFERWTGASILGSNAILCRSEVDPSDSPRRND